MTRLASAWVPIVAGVTLAAGADPKPVPAVTVADLAKGYLGNEAYGDEQYTGRVVEAAGEVRRVFRHHDKAVAKPGYVVEMVAAKGSPARTTPVTVQAVFAADLRAKLAELKPEQAIVVRGVCYGKTSGADPQRVVIQLKECELIGSK